MPGRHSAPATVQTKQYRRSTIQHGEPTTATVQTCGRLPHRRQQIPMITQPNPQIKDQLATPDVQHGPHLHLPGLSHLRPVRQDSRNTGTRTPNIVLAGLQLLVGYEWLLAGGDKFLLGTFPAQLGGLLNTLVSSGHLAGFFVAILQGLVAPNAVLFGYLIESGETLVVYGDRLLSRLAPLAAAGAGLLGLSYFFLDGTPSPWFVPSIAFGGSIDSGLFFAAASVVLIVSQFVQRQSSR